MLRLIIFITALTASLGAHAALVENCRVQHREITASGLIRWSEISSTLRNGNLHFVSPNDQKNYRFRLFMNQSSTSDTIYVDGIIQDLSVNGGTGANGYIAHGIVEVQELSEIPSFVVASESNQLVVECKNLVARASR